MNEWYEIVTRQSGVRKFEYVAAIAYTERSAKNAQAKVALQHMDNGYRGGLNAGDVYRLEKRDHMGRRIRLAISVRRVQRPAFSAN